MISTAMAVFCSQTTFGLEPGGAGIGMGSSFRGTIHDSDITEESGMVVIQVLTVTHNSWGPVVASICVSIGSSWSFLTPGLMEL